MSKTFKRTIIIFIGIIILSIPVFASAKTYPLSFSTWINSKNNPANQPWEVKGDIYLPYSGEYKVVTHYRADSGSYEKYEEYKVFFNGNLLGTTNDPNQVDDYEIEKLGTFNFSKGTHRVRIIHAWDYNEKGDQTVYPLEVSFELLSTNQTNHKPQANAGPDKQVNENNSVKLEGSGSDPDGDSINYSWSCTGGSLSNSNIAQPTFNAPSVSSDTNYTCNLTVTNEHGASDSDNMVVKVKDISQTINDPLVISNSATNISYNSATLNGYLADLGGDNYSEVWFEWGKTTSYGNSTSKVNKNSISSFERNITGLDEDTLYHFRAVGENSNGKSYGSDRSLLTLGSSNNPPQADAGSDKYVDEGDSIRLNGSGYDSDGDNLNYHWSCQSGSLSAENSENPLYYAPSISSDTNYTCTLTVTDEHGAADSDSMVVYVNNKDSIEVRTRPADEIEENSAVLKGDLRDLGGNDYVKVYFQWGRTSYYGNKTSDIYRSNSGYFEEEIYGLRKDTLYHFRAVVEENDGEVNYGEDRSFKTDGGKNDVSANAGPDKEVYENDTINIYGSGYGDSLDYYWDCENGEIDNPYEDDIKYRAPYVSSNRYYNCTLRVTDRYGDSDYDTMRILVKDRSNYDILRVEKSVKNVTRGDSQWYEKYIHASPNDIVSFRIEIKADGGNLDNLTLRDNLPLNLIYQENLTIDGNYISKDITKEEINLGDINSGESKIITFLAKVAGRDNFNYGSTDLINTSVVESNESSEADSVKVIVVKKGIAGISTGVTNNLFFNTLLIPLILSLALIWLFRSEIIGLDKIIAKRKENIVSYRSKKKLEKKINKLRGRI